MLIELKKWAKSLRENVKILGCAFYDGRTPWYVKALVVLIIAYALSPIDLIPDFIPVLGLLDDLLILPIGIYFALKLTPQVVLDECRSRSSEKLGKKFGRLGWVAAIAIVVSWVILALAIYSWFK